MYNPYLQLSPVAIVSDGEWITITPAWVLDRLARGLTPRDYDAIALLAHYNGIDPDEALRLAQLAAESEVRDVT